MEKQSTNSANESKKKDSDKLSTIESFNVCSVRRNGTEVIVIGHGKMESVIYLVNDSDIARPIRVGIKGVRNPGDYEEMKQIAEEMI